MKFRTNHTNGVKYHDISDADAAKLSREADSLRQATVRAVAHAHTLSVEQLEEAVADADRLCYLAFGLSNESGDTYPEEGNGALREAQRQRAALDNELRKRRTERQILDNGLRDAVHESMRAAETIAAAVAKIEEGPTAADLPARATPAALSHEDMAAATTAKLNQIRSIEEGRLRGERGSIAWLDKIIAALEKGLPAQTKKKALSIASALREQGAAALAVYEGNLQAVNEEIRARSEKQAAEDAVRGDMASMVLDLQRRVAELEAAGFEASDSR